MPISAGYPQAVTAKVDGSSEERVHLNSKVEQSKTASTGGDIVKYVVAGLLVVAGLVAYWMFKGQWPNPLPAIAAAAGIVLGGLVFMLSAKGRDLREYLAESRFELRKVVWPTRQEAMRLTWFVMVAVAIISLILAGFDFLIQKAIALLFTLGR